jgi:hypothetical protein
MFLKSFNFLLISKSKETTIVITDKKMISNLISAIHSGTTVFMKSRTADLSKFSL